MMTEKQKSNWGNGIFFLYGAFVIFILSIVVFASFQDFHLVDQNYYEKEIAYQGHIDMVNRTGELSEQLSVEQNPEEKAVTINFPALIESSRIGGQIVLFRPSDASMDQTLAIDPDEDNRQIINLNALAKGQWRLMIYWTVDTAAYFNQADIFLP